MIAMIRFPSRAHGRAACRLRVGIAPALWHPALHDLFDYRAEDLLLWAQRGRRPTGPRLPGAAGLRQVLHVVGRGRELGVVPQSARGDVEVFAHLPLSSSSRSTATATCRALRGRPTGTDVPRAHSTQGRHRHPGDRTGSYPGPVAQSSVFRHDLFAQFRNGERHVVGGTLDLPALSGEVGRTSTAPAVATAARPAAANTPPTPAAASTRSRNTP